MGSRADINSLLSHVSLIKEGYEASLRDDLALKESAFAKMQEQFRPGNPPIYYRLASYLNHGRKAIFENGGRAVLNSPDLNHRVIGAIMLNLNVGFRIVLDPLLVADLTFSQVSDVSNQEKGDLESQAKKLGIKVSKKVIDQSMEHFSRRWNDWKRLVKQDPTGVLLIERELVEVQRRKPIGNQVKELVVAGAQMAVSVYKDFYPEAKRLIDAKQSN